MNQTLQKKQIPSNFNNPDAKKYRVPNQRIGGEKIKMLEKYMEIQKFVLRQNAKNKIIFWNGMPKRAQKQNRKQFRNVNINYFRI